jgi:hypothetical protein
MAVPSTGVAIKWTCGIPAIEPGSADCIHRFHRFHRFSKGRPGVDLDNAPMERGGDVLVAVPKAFPMAMRTSPPRILSKRKQSQDATEYRDATVAGCAWVP